MAWMAQAKYFAGETVSLRSKSHADSGGVRLFRGIPGGRFYQDAPTYTMVEGSANICKIVIAMDRLGIKKANR
ncbi:MAG: hypothetical protein R2860_12230 [Desulfobacterales bacterium]